MQQVAVPCIPSRVCLDLLSASESVTVSSGADANVFACMCTGAEAMKALSSLLNFDSAWN